MVTGRKILRKHRAQAKLLNICESVWPENDGPLPWRLTKQDKVELDLRMRNVVWPATLRGTPLLQRFVRY